MCYASLALRCSAVAGRVFRTAIALLAGLSAALTAPVSSANVTYTYTGHNFTIFQDVGLPAYAYNTSMSVSGSFEVASAFAPSSAFIVTPLSYSFTDGQNLITSALPPTFINFDGGTDASGQIDTWNVQLRDEPSPGTGNVRQIVTDWGTLYGGGEDSGIIEINAFSGGGFADGGNNSARGSWTVAVSAVPEPETYALLLAGLGPLVFAIRRRKLKENSGA